MVSMGSKFFQNFRFKSDAVPRPPRSAETLNANNPEERFDKDDDTASINSIPEEVIIEPDESQEDEKKGKSKKPFFFSKKKNKNGFGPNKPEKDPKNPINTQATGNVINIVNCNDVRWGNEITYNLGTSNPNWQQRQTDDTGMEVKKTKSIVLLMEATIKPEHEYIDYISKNLGKNWHSFFKTLGYSQGRIETVEIDEARNGVSEARYKLLLDWIRNDNVGTLGHLSTLLWQEGERQIVKELAIIYKKSTSSNV